MPRIRPVDSGATQPPRRRRASRPERDGGPRDRVSLGAAQGVPAARLLFPPAAPGPAPLWNFRVGKDTPDATRQLGHGPDGTLYALVHDGDRREARLAALDPDTGRPRWEVEVGGEVLCAPVATAGSVLVGGRGVRALDPADPARTLWHNDKLTGPVQGLALSPDGRQVYVSQGWGGLSALDAATGKRLWHRKAECQAPVCVGPDGTVYAGEGSGGFSGAVRAMGPDGKQKWRHPTEGAVDGTPVLDSQGRLFFTEGCNLTALAAESGEPLWTMEKESSLLAPCLDGEGRPVVPGMDGRVYCADPATGDEAWSFKLPKDDCPLEVDRASDGSLLVAGEGGKVFALDGATGQERWALDHGTDRAWLSGVADRRVFLADASGRLDALRLPEPAPPTPPAPGPPEGIVEAEGHVQVGEITLPRRTGG